MVHNHPDNYIEPGMPPGEIIAWIVCFLIVGVYFLCVFRCS